MELPFEIIKILKYVEREPGILVAYAAFHPVALLLLYIPFIVFKKIGLYKPKDTLSKFGFSLTMTILVGWIMGFVSQILLFFMGVSGIKMLLIYLSMYLCIIFYVLFNANGLQKKVYERNPK